MTAASFSFTAVRSVSLLTDTFLQLRRGERISKVLNIGNFSRLGPKSNSRGPNVSSPRAIPARGIQNFVALLLVAAAFYPILHRATVCGVDDAQLSPPAFHSSSTCRCVPSADVDLPISRRFQGAASFGQQPIRPMQTFSGLRVHDFSLRREVMEFITHRRKSSPELALKRLAAKSIQNCVMCEVIHPRKPMMHGRLPPVISSATCFPECWLIGTSDACSFLKSPNRMTGYPARVRLRML